ncbi:unnamed protein product [Strongylus vulgaris]|uniref:Uncharacterized protein n=1 Tax=Strongylus vulgaris TaxID=40348 RepID=A0A3P7J3L8_STRVU|nr:unnamed protein product [Strongylus vulgaris]
MELERSQNTGLPIRGTVVIVFGGKDTVTGIQAVEGGDHFLVHGEYYCCLLHQSYLVEGGVAPEHRILRLPAPIRSLNVERHGKNDLLLSFLLENGVFHYSLSTHMEDSTFECLQCYRCTRPIQSGLLWRDGGILHAAYYDGFVRVGIIVEERPIQSGLLWRDGGILHAAYYDGFVRVGIIVEEYDDMLLVQARI